MKAQQRTVAESVASRRVRTGIIEFGLMGVLFALYYATRGLAAGKQADAYANAHQVIDLERRLGLFRETGIQAWVLTEPMLVRVLNFFYAYAHMAGLVLFAAWVFFYHQPRYREIRNTFLVILCGGLLIYVLYPLAPPRFFPSLGFHDTLALYSGINYDQPSLAMLYNPFAAMPSLHVAFALFSGLGLIRIGRSLIHYLIGIGFPLLMTTTVVATGNHYILDAVAGATLTVLAYLIVPRLLALRARMATA